METLFRKEAYEAKVCPTEGETFIHQPVASRLLSAGALLITLLFLLLLFFGEYTNKARVVGYLEPETGLLPIWSTTSGIVREIYVTDGQSVRKGEPLFLIASEQTSLSNADTALVVVEQLIERKNQLSLAVTTEEQLQELEVDSLKTTHQENLAQYQQIQAELSLIQQKVMSQAEITKSYETLHKKGFVADLEIKKSQQQLLDFQAQEQTLASRLINLQNALARTDSDIKKRQLMGIKARQALQQQLFVIEQNIAEQQQKNASVVLAPDDGVISTLQIYKNQMATNNQRLATLIPQNVILKAKLIVPSKAAGFVRPDQTVSIRYPAFPYQKFGIEHGTVKDVDQTLTIPGEQALPTTITEPVYLVSVSLDAQSIHAYGKQYALKTGMSLEADIDLETRTLIEWLLEPIIGFTKKV